MEFLVLQILALAVLGGLLVFLDDRGTRSEIQNYTWDGAAFDADELLHRVQSVGTDYITALHSHRHLHRKPIGHLIKTCRRVSGKSYFRSRPTPCASVIGEELEDRDSSPSGTKPGILNTNLHV